MSAYATVEDLKNRILLEGEDLTEAQETVLEEILEAISRKIDNHCGRRENAFATSTEALYKYYVGNGKNYLRIDPCLSVTGVAVKTTYSSEDYTAWTTPTTAMAGDGDWIPCRGSPEHPVYGETPYEMLFIDPNGDYSIFTAGLARPTVRVNAIWGYSESVPADIREACVAQATILYKRYQGSMADTLGTSDLGVLSMKIRRGALTRDVQELLDNSGWVLTLYGSER